MKFILTIFTSSFLLFLVQPLLAKMMLPFLGGGAAVWTACMLFFQLFLLLGYLYAHLLCKFLKVKHQVIFHCVLVGLGIIIMPITPLASSSGLAQGTPLYQIFDLLLNKIGLSYFLLSSTAPLIQKWYSYLYPDRSTYKLYSLSNLGSFLALFSYPFIMEPTMNTSIQANVWSVGYVLFSILIFVAAYKTFVFSKNNAQPINLATALDENEKQPTKARITDALLWLLFSATGVILFVSTTNNMTQNVPPTPFLWLLPLGIYLLTYIICFNNEKYYVRWYWLSFFVVSSVTAIFLFFIGTHFDIISQIVMYSVILLSASMVCHGELARLKPEVSQLTWFYLVISAGGVLGGLFTSVVAEKIFTQYYEFLIGIGLVYLLFGLTFLKNFREIPPQGSLNKVSNKLALLNAAGLICFVMLFVFLDNLYSQHDIYRSRNFYGILAVKDIKDDNKSERQLVDGSTSHGVQSLLAEDELIPKSYYRYGTGVGIALEENIFDGGKRVGIIGLGAGTLASYGKPNDTFVFYELNPDVDFVAKTYFSYLSNTLADVSVTLGDGRVSLKYEYEKIGSQNYQILVLDAFLSDSIPMHLLTLEAFQLYKRHLSKDGMLVIHISNTHFNLLPLIKNIADKLAMQSLHFITLSNNENIEQAEWVVITNNARFLSNNEVLKKAQAISMNNEDSPLWTDDFSNLLSVLKL